MIILLEINREDEIFILDNSVERLLNTAMGAALGDKQSAGETVTNISEAKPHLVRIWGSLYNAIIRERNEISLH